MKLHPVICKACDLGPCRDMVRDPDILAMVGKRCKRIQLPPGERARWTYDESVSRARREISEQGERLEREMFFGKIKRRPPQ